MKGRLLAFKGSRPGTVSGTVKALTARVRVGSVSSMTATMGYNLISRWSGALGVCAIVAIIRPAHADPRAVVEIFTSQGCS